MIGMRLVTTMALALSTAASALAQQGGAPRELAEQDVRREFGYVLMKDGVRLASVVWLPKAAGRYPIVFAYGPYNEDAAAFQRARRFLDAGYGFLGVNMRGTGCSEGIDTEGGGSRPATVGRDGADVVEWAARQPWSSGSVGMVGTSYEGELQFAVAANSPPHLKAIVPSGISAADYRESYVPGGMVHLGGMASWSLEGQGSLADPAQEIRIAAGDTACAAIRAKHRPNEAFDELNRHPLEDAWWAERSGEAMAGQVTVPTLILMGWQDEWNLGAGTRMFQLLGSPHKKIILQNGGHGVGAVYKIDLDATLRWLDRWVKGTRNGMDEEPPVTVHWEVRSAAATPGWTTGYASWPPPNTVWLTFYLTADGRLTREQPAADPTRNVRSYLYPSGTEIIGNNEQFALAPYHLGSLSYRTDPTPEDMVILGLPNLRFFVSSEQTNTDFFVTLKDVDAAGNTLFLQRDFLRASMRAVDEARSTPNEIIHSFSKNEELVPGKIYEIKLSIPSIGAVVRKGHRLELSILAPSPIPAPVMGGVPIGLPSLNKVYSGDEYPSTLRVPVIPGERAQADAPECGSLPFQPCRHAVASRQTQ